MRFAAVSLGLILVLMAAVTVIVPRTGLARWLELWVQEATGAETKLDSLTVQWSGGFGLVLHKGQLRGTGQALRQRQGFETDLGRYEITFDQLKLKLSVLPLLRGTFAVHSVRVVGSLASAEVFGEVLVLRDYDLKLAHIVYPVGEVMTGENITFSLALSSGQYIGQATVWSQVSFEGKWMANELHLPRVRGRLGSGRLEAAVVLTWQDEGPGRISGSVRWFEVPSQEFLAPYLPSLAEKLRCDLDGEVVGSMSLVDGRARRESSDLTVKLSAGAGVLDARDWFYQASHYLGDRQDLQIIAFERLYHRGKIKAGHFEIETLELEGPETSWHVAGEGEFGGELQVGIDLRLPPGFTPDLGSMAFLAEMLRDEQGRINLSVKLTGKTAAPVVSADIQRMMQRR